MNEGELKKRVQRIVEGNRDILEAIVATWLVIDEAKKEIPEALIINSKEYEDGYCHDDVWIMMEWIKKWFGGLK